MLNWREYDLIGRPGAFVVAHGCLKLVAIVVGFAATTICLMAVMGIFTDRLVVRGAVSVTAALVMPGLVVSLVRPKDDPIGALGLPSDTYAFLLLGFAVLFALAAHGRAAPLLIREGDRDAQEGLGELARAAWFLADVRPVAPPAAGTAASGN